MGFYHVSLTGQWRVVVGEQMHQLRESGLLEATDRLHVTVLGNVSEWDGGLLAAAGKAKQRTTLHRETKLWEYPTIGALYDYCVHDGGGQDATNDDFVYYFHSKGTNSPDPTAMRALGAKDWRDIMMYFVFYRWKECVEVMDKRGKVACGVNLHGVGSTGVPAHYSGNFWWTRCSYVREHLRHPLLGATEFFLRYWAWMMPPDRMYGEGWVLDSELMQKENVAHECFRTNTDHYNWRFDVESVRRAGTRCAGV